MMNYSLFYKVVLFLFLLNFKLSGQVQLLPLENNPVILNYNHKNASRLKNNQNCTTLTLNLPFFEDFSRSTSIYPNCEKWQDNHAYINQTMANNPPSIGIATLDGLNPEGRPYDSLSDPNTAFPADTLTSQLIDLSGKTAANNIIFSYFYQPQGLADRPEINDSLLLEFMDNSGNWQLIQKHPGVSNLVSQLEIPTFSQGFVMVKDSAYFHSGFQFRFRNRASICGNNDHWHLDHLYLDENRTDTTAPVYYSDVSFTKVPVSAFKKYTAIPWNHFSPSLWNDTLSMRTFNHSNQSGPLDRTYIVEDTSNLGTALINVATPSFNYQPSPNFRDSYDTVLSGSFGTFNPTGPTLLKSTYTIDNPTAFQNNPIFAKNDTTFRYTVLDNYFAYDDGIPEMRAILQGVGTQLAVEFKTIVDDTLRGIYFHLPYYLNRNAEQDFINVKVWVDNLNNEIYSRDIYRLNYEEGFGGLHYVQLVDFNDSITPIPLAANTTFYVGWQQASTTPVPVGVDRSVDRDDRTFIKIGGNNWINTDINSAVMLRPLLSLDSSPNVISTEQIPANKFDFIIFPNPGEDIINLICDENSLDSKAKISIYNQTGQKIIEKNFSKQLDISNLSAGLYFIELNSIQNGNQVKKFIKK